MKSSKKHFKIVLADIEQAARELLLLSTQLTLLEEMKAEASKVLQLCKVLRSRAALLKKKNFIEMMSVDEAVIELDAMADLDLISQLEERLSVAFAGSAESQASEMVQQLLEKMEKRYTDMLDSIQQLTGLLVDAG